MSASHMPNRDWRELLAIFLGGATGGALRVGLALAFPTAAGQWPWVTFTVNILGAFLLGYFTTRLQERLPLSTYRRPLLGTGFCGAFTTFSTLQVELVKMLDRGDLALGAAYAIGCLAVGYLAIYLSTALVRRVRVIV
jgi:CrcB protein